MLPNQCLSLMMFLLKLEIFKYLGILVDSKLSFQSHIEYIKKRLSKQCGIICKLRHYVPRKQLIDYYQSNVKPIIQYGILVYGTYFVSAEVSKMVLFLQNNEVYT